MPRDFSDLRPGIDVLLEFDNIEGEVTLRKVTSNKPDDDPDDD